MKTFQLLYFRESVLAQAEEVQVRDVLEAIEKATGQPADIRVEIWSGNRRVGIIGPSPCSCIRSTGECPIYIHCGQSAALRHSLHRQWGAAMSSFGYLSVLLSIIIGLAVTQILQGMRALMLARETARLFVPSLIWAVVLLLIATQMWWSSFGLRDHTEWTFGLYGLILLQIGLFYLACGLVLPDLSPEKIDLEADYFRNRGWFFGLLGGAAVVSILKDVALDGRLPGTANLIFHLILIASCGAAILSANRRYHAVLAPASLLLFAGYIALLFARL